jgi:hypothetical protein
MDIRDPNTMLSLAQGKDITDGFVWSESRGRTCNTSPKTNRRIWNSVALPGASFYFTIYLLVTMKHLRDTPSSVLEGDYGLFDTLVAEIEDVKPHIKVISIKDDGVRPFKKQRMILEAVVVPTVKAIYGQESRKVPKIKVSKIRSRILVGWISTRLRRPK